MNIRNVFSRRVCAALVLLACAASTAGAQEQQAVFGDTSRLASIGGSVTEIVYALGQQDKLVARDSTSLYPEEATKLPDVGYMRALSPEGLLSVNPSGILLLDGSGPVEAIDVLKKASVPVISIPDVYNHAGILEKIKVVGHALGADDEATKLAAQVDADLSAAEKLTSDIAERQRVLFILSLQGGKVLAAGSGTAADGIISLAGGVNAIEGLAGYKPLSDESIIEARPDVILMMTRGGGHTAANDELLAHPAIAPTPAGQAKRVVRLDGNYLLGFGPRTAGAVRELATALYGEKIKE